MSARSRFALSGVLTLILLLALTIPGMAKGSVEPTCRISVLTVDKSGEYDFNMHVYADEFKAGWDGGTLINKCWGWGAVPFEEPIGEQMVYATFGEACKFFLELGGECDMDGGYFRITLDDYDGAVQVIDPDTSWPYWATYAAATVYSNGDFYVYKEYAP